MPDLSCVYDLHHSSQQGRILNPLSEARDRTHNLMVPSQIRFHCSMTGTPLSPLYHSFFFLMYFIFVKYLFFFCFLGLHPQHMEVPRLGVESELHLPAYATATATPDWSRICDLCCSLGQHKILNPLNEARDQTCILVEMMAGP